MFNLLYIPQCLAPIIQCLFNIVLLVQFKQNAFNWVDSTNISIVLHFDTILFFLAQQKIDWVKSFIWCIVTWDMNFCCSILQILHCSWILPPFSDFMSFSLEILVGYDPSFKHQLQIGLNVLYAPCWSGISRETWSCCLKMSLDDRRDTKAGKIRRADPAHITFSPSVSGRVTSSRRPPSSSMWHEPRPPHTTPAPGWPASSPILPKRHSPFRRSSKSPPLTWSWVLSNHPKLDRISQSTPGNPP